MTATALAHPAISHARRRIAGGVSRRVIVEVTSSLTQSPPSTRVDMRRILRLREAIARETYDSTWRLDEALNRMIDRVLRDR